jgi:hypothetical protein
MCDPLKAPRRDSRSSTTMICQYAMVVGLIVAVYSTRGLADEDLLYQKYDTLCQTMLETKARLQAWQACQQQAQQLVQWDAWHAVKLPAGVVLDEQRFTTLNTQLDAAVPEGVSCLPCPASDDGGPNPPRLSTGETAPIDADYLLAVVRATEPTRLTLELSRHEAFGGFAYRPGVGGPEFHAQTSQVWVNGQQLQLNNRLAGYEHVPVAKRRGWRDCLLIDLPLQSGENRVLVKLHAGSQRSWFNAIRVQSDPAAILWSMIEVDFPRANHHLLASVPHNWFDAQNGWFAHDRSHELEQQFLDQVLHQLGKKGHVVKEQRDCLATTATPGEWLRLCITAAEAQAAIEGLDCLHDAVTQIGNVYAQAYPGQRMLADIARLRHDVNRLIHGGIESGAAGIHERLEKLRREALVDLNPLLLGKRVLFLKRKTYDSNHYYDEHCHGTREFGGGLFTLDSDLTSVDEVAPNLSQGLVDRYDLSFDAKRIVFSYKPPKPEGYRIYEVGVDGTGFRQVTRPPDDEAERIATYSMVSWNALKRNPGGYGHWTDDLHPCYLPDGRIVFTSTRSESSVLCGGHSLTVANLHRINRDGTGLQQLSQGALSEFCPTIMNDGRIMYNRWEYVDKGAGAVQSLWAMSPDGSRSEEIYGNNITTPGVFTQAQHIPDKNNLVVCLGASHCPGNNGAVLLIDLQKNKRTDEPMTVLTPGCVPKGNWGLRQFRNGRWITDIYGPWYCDPYPLSDPNCPSIGGKFFLVSCNPDGQWNDPAGYGIYLLDVFGNRIPIHRDEEFSCFQPRVLAPRGRPPVIPDLYEPGDTASSTTRDVDADGNQRDATGEYARAGETATLLVADVYQGLDGVARGTVKYLRVMEQVARPWSVYQDYSPRDQAPGQMVAISLYTHLSVKILHGIVPVHEDGSAFFTVPANRNIFLQALDEEFMEVQRMRTFVNFQPGEQRSCIGCHELRNQVPQNHRPLALATGPVSPQAQPGEVAPRPLHYPSDVQPIFDQHCVSCHGSVDPDGDLDLTGDPTDLFCRSYETIINRQLVPYIQEFIGPKPAGADAMGYAPTAPPYTYSSHHSDLVSTLRAGHYDVRLSREEMVRLVTWVDANAPYYGSYFGRRHLADQNRGDFRPVPTLASASGIRPDPVPVVAPPRAPKPTKLLAWWTCDETDQNQLTDEAGKSGRAEIVGPVAIVPGRRGKAVSLEGHSFIRASIDSDSLPAFTLAMWIRPASRPDGIIALLQTDDWGRDGVHFQLFENGSASLAVFGSDPLRLSTRAKVGYKVGSWQHLAIVYDAEDQIGEFYVNGVLESALKYTTAAMPRFGKFCIGSWNQGGRFFHGAVDDVRIYSGPLSVEMIQALAELQE